MHRVLVRSYKYRYGMEGIVPGTRYNDFLLDPKSVSLGRSEIARIGKSRFARGINTVLYLCKSVLYIDWKEYPFEYLKEHLMEMKTLFDRIRTDALLEEIDDSEQV